MGTFILWILAIVGGLTIISAFMQTNRQRLSDKTFSELVKTNQSINTFQQSKTLSSINPKSQRLFNIALNGISMLDKAYKVVPTNGRFEVLLFNTVLVLQQYHAKGYGDYDVVESSYLQLLKKQSHIWNIGINSQILLDFIYNRMELYGVEILKYSSEDKNFISTHVYSNFYIKPLLEKPLNGMEYLFEYLEFVEPYFKMMRNVIMLSQT